MEFGVYETLLFACVVLYVGKYLVHKIHFFQKYNIPEPVVGGFLFALLCFGIKYVWNIEFEFEDSLREVMMLVFFSSIGLSADMRKLFTGDKVLFIFLLVAAGFIVLQNLLGISLAALLDIDKRFGLIAGSITLTGGHGTVGGWADDFLKGDNPMIGVKEIGMACATFGLIMGGVLGGPLAGRLLKKSHIPELSEEEIKEIEDTHDPSHEAVHASPVNYRNVMETIAMLSICLVAGKYLSEWNAQFSFKLPSFVWCLFIGIFIRSVFSFIWKDRISNVAIEMIGNVGLSLFLAIALMTLKLWLIVGLAFKIVVILFFQVLLMWFYAYYVTYRVMGKNYDAIVLAAGHCGFGLGATPTAVANIQAVMNRYGFSYKAFIVIPMVGAFFVDILNAIILNFFVNII